jgi:hypothetical protein
MQSSIDESTNNTTNLRKLGPYNGLKKKNKREIFANFTQGLILIPSKPSLMGWNLLGIFCSLINESKQKRMFLIWLTKLNTYVF